MNENWTFAEAVQHLVPPLLRTEEERARSARTRKGRFVLSPGIHGDTDPRYREFKINERAWRMARLGIEKVLAEKIAAGSLVVMGRFGSVSADPKPIPPSGWQNVRVIDWQRSIGREHLTRTPIFDIRISIAGAKDLIGHQTSEGLQKTSAAVKTEAAFVRLLVRIIRSSPQMPCLTRKQLEQGDVANSWGLGIRAIRRSWSSAIEKADMPAWRHAGRRSEHALATLPEWARRELGLASA